MTEIRDLAQNFSDPPIRLPEAVRANSLLRSVPQTTGIRLQAPHPGLAAKTFQQLTAIPPALSSFGLVMGEFTYLPIERVRFGPGAVENLSEELDRLGVKRPFVVTGRTIAEKTNLVAKVERAAGRGLAGTYSGVRQHAPLSAIRDTVNEARSKRVDALISLGGGSPIDAAKIAVMELSENFARPPIPHIAIPTTLSAAEFSHLAGMTEETAKRKTGFADIRLAARLVFVDPEMTVHTPSWLWASTGIRSLDHAVEAVYSPRHQPFVDTLALEAIRLLFQNLKASSKDQNNLSARFACQIAAWMSFAGVVSVGTGLSHAIGRTIGATWDIPHGITSCITLAEVMKFEAERKPDRLALIATASGRVTAGSSLVEAAGIGSRAVQDLVSELGLVKRLSDYGISRADLPKIAEECSYLEPKTEVVKILANLL